MLGLLIDRHKEGCGTNDWISIDRTNKKRIG